MKRMYCITCPLGCQLTVIGTGYDMVVEGNKCSKGSDFAKGEMSNPSRTLTTTVRTKFPGIPVLSVRTAGEIPRDKLMKAMRELSEVVIEEELACGDVIVEDVARTGVSVIVTSSALMQLGAELENKNAELERRGASGSSAAAVVSGSGQQGVGIVRDAGAVDSIGLGTADGFVGAAGEAVGVEGAEGEDDLTADEGSGGSGRIRPSSRPHIKR